MRLGSIAGTAGCLLFLCGTASAVAQAVPPRDPAPSPTAERRPVSGPYLLADAATGRVIDHFDAMRPWFPASTSKLMSVYVAFRAVLAGEIALDTPIVYSAAAAKAPPSKMAFKPGSMLTLDDALKIMMVKSANDVAVAVAEAVGGSVDAFAERMNREAGRLGMARSHFVNPHGLPDARQVTTARDMALLARALLLEFPQYRDYFRIPAIEVGGKVLENFNPLLERYPGANGMKTGFICASGYNLVASARRGDREVIAVVFGEYGGMARAEHAAALLDKGFQASAGPGAPATTLASVASGAAYTSPLDMRPFVCGPRQASASEANTDAASGKPGNAQPSHLGPPMVLGPPVRIAVLAPPADRRPGDSGFVARMPRPRPALPSDTPRGAVVDVLAPFIAAGRTGAAKVREVGNLLARQNKAVPAQLR